MDIERDDDAASRKIRFLMRMLTNLNAGGMLALRLWLAWAAVDFNVRQTRESAAITVHGCGCVLDEITTWPG